MLVVTLEAEAHWMNDTSGQTTAMVFAGGLGLAAYQAGVYEAFEKQGEPLHWMTGSSAGAITAALIAGIPKDRRIAGLRAFWNSPPIEHGGRHAWDHLNGWVGAIGTRLLGSAGHFHPRVPSLDLFRFRSFYDLAPMRARLAECLAQRDTRRNASVGRYFAPRAFETIVPASCGRSHFPIQLIEK